ncbi:MAG: amidohydrolase [Cyclobacteriaceae bacterium]
MKEELNVALIQSDLYWEKVDANLAMFEEKIWQIEHADLIILPEMFTTGFSTKPQGISEPVNGHTLRWMKQMAAQTKAVIIGSYIVKEHPHFFNRCYVVFPDGRAEHYDKKHLFALAGEDQHFKAGDRKLVIDVLGWNVCPLICYDLRFPVWSRAVAHEYDLLIYIANWPIPRINAWDTLLTARAIENQSYCIGVNRVGIDGVNAEYNGHSGLYDYSGERLLFSETEDILQTSISKTKLASFRTKFPFQKESDPFLFS